MGALLHNTGHSEVVVAAGILHDTVEDTGIRAGDIADRFGEEPDHQLVRQLRFELEALQPLPPGSIED